MELKQYQKEVIADLDAYIGYVEKYNRPDTAFHKFWEDKGVSISSYDNYYLHPYDNSVTGVPHVTVKSADRRWQNFHRLQCVEYDIQAYACR